MLRVRKDLCMGCGLCVQSCPRGAISLPRGQAVIDQNRCDSCHLCLEVCAQGAIAEMMPVSGGELGHTVAALQDKTDDLLQRLARLRG